MKSGQIFQGLFIVIPGLLSLAVVIRAITGRFDGTDIVLLPIIFTCLFFLFVTTILMNIHKAVVALKNVAAHAEAKEPENRS